MRGPRGWLAWFLLGNCFVPYGVYQFTIQSQGVTNPPAEYRIVPAKPPAPAVSLRFDRGWSDEEWKHERTWRWGIASHATLTLSNPTNCPIEISLSFTTGSINPRNLKISVRRVDLWSTRSLQSKLAVQTPRFLIPPGDTAVDFDSPGSPVQSGHWNDDRLLSFMVQDLQVNLSAPP
jgi:hypothetical protein